MDEAAYLKAIADSPYDKRLVRKYAAWLIQQEDQRGEYLELELERQSTQHELRRLEQKLGDFGFRGVADSAWLDQVNPLYVTSPMVGIVYLARTPDASPFVKEGDTCNVDTTVVIIEALKLFHEIPADINGVVAEILVSNLDVVEFAQPLVRIERPPRLLAGG